MKTTFPSHSIFLYFFFGCFSFGLLSGCDSDNSDSIFQSAMLEGLWEVRTTAVLSDGVLVNSNITERNSEWLHITDVVGGDLMYGTYQLFEDGNCIRNLQMIGLVEDGGGRYLAASDREFFGNIGVTLRNNVLTTTTETSLTLARERIDITFSQLVICE